MAWYNPLTWFKNTPTQPTQPTQSQSSGTGGVVPLSGATVQTGTSNLSNLSNLTGGNTGGSLSGTILSGNNSGKVNSSVITSLGNINNNQTYPTINLSDTIIGPKETYLVPSDPTYKAENPYKSRSIWQRMWNNLTHPGDNDPNGPYGSTLLGGAGNPVEEELSAKWKRDQAKKNATKLEGFSLDEYGIDTNNTGKTVDLAVESKEGGASITDKVFGTEDEWMNSMFKAFSNVMINNASEGKEPSISDIYKISKNTVELQYPNTIGQWTTNREVSSKYGGALEFEDKEGKTKNDKLAPHHEYEGKRTQAFQKDLGGFAELKAYFDEGYIEQELYDEAVDALYDAYKDDIYTVEHRYTAPRIKAGYGLISRDAFERYLVNEIDKADYRAEVIKKKGLPNENDTESQRVQDSVDVEMSIIAPVIELSEIRTVEDRQEALTDGYAAAYDFAGRMYASLWDGLSVKAGLQAELGVDNLWDLTIDEVPDERKGLYLDIQRLEKNYNQFIKNHGEYVAAVFEQGVNPETGKIDEIPEFLQFGDKTYTYTDKIFAGIDLKDEDTYLWNGPALGNQGLSPIDAIRNEARNIHYKWNAKTGGTLSQVWENVQYYGAKTIGSTYGELGQNMWRIPLAGYNVLSSDSGEIPFEFIDMDSSILATLTTNDSNRGALLQGYGSKVFEYAPELVAAIKNARDMDKIGEAIGMAGQARVLAYLNKFPKLRNSVKGQQLIQGIAYTIRAGQRLGTDQLFIDAPLSVYDTEFGSDFSQKLSIYGTLLGEGIGILSDLRALNKSVWMNFKKTNKWDAINDPIRLLAEDSDILEGVAEHLGRVSIDTSGKIKGDPYKLLIQDLSSYSKYLNDLSKKVTNIVTSVLTEGGKVDVANDIIKKGAYNVLKQVFNQNSAMSKIVTDLITDNRANIADIVKYIGRLDGTIKIGPFVSTIKMSKGNLVNRIAKSYNPGMDLVIDGGLVAGINRGLTKAEVDELVRQGYIKSSDISAQGDKVFNAEKYFAPYKMADGTTRYFPTEEGLKMLGVDVSKVDDALVITAMSDDAKKLIDTLKKLPENKRMLGDFELDKIGETDAITKLAENIANIKYLDICK